MNGFELIAKSKHCAKCDEDKHQVSYPFSHGYVF